ncbi:MAG TPA: hypothetical protein VHP83_16180 [Aggregatilineaceae bacterium]|nr:hypothetical protein [Aggregatilineaceae bacterium]
MKPEDIQVLFPEAQRAIGAPIGPAMQEKIEASHLQDGLWGALAVALDFEPEPTTVEKFLAHNPYTNPQNFAERFQTLTEQGLFEESSAGEYRITTQGHAAANTVLDVMTEKLRETNPLPAADIHRIADLLLRLIAAALDAPEPADKSGLVYNRHSDLGEAAPPMLRVLQYLADMGTFRDDAHLNAWRKHAISGPAWEALTLVWRGEAHHAAELVEKLPFRRWTAADYQAALDELARRGWIEADGDQVRVTEAGQRMREAAEAETDRVYYAPWSVLSAAELNELGEGLIRLRDQLQEVA